MKRTAWILAATAAAMAALAWAWPQLIAGAPEERAAGWVPELDPGVVLTIDASGRREEYGWGPRQGSLSFATTVGQVRRSELQLSTAERVGGRVSTTAGSSPSRTSRLRVGAGWLQNEHLAAAVELADGQVLRRSLGPPIVLGSARRHGELATIDELGLRIAWRADAHFEVEVHAPAGTAPAPGGGLLVAGELVPWTVETTAAGRRLHARMPAAASGWGGRATRTRVAVGEKAGALLVVVDLALP